MIIGDRQPDTIKASAYFSDDIVLQRQGAIVAFTGIIKVARFQLTNDPVNEVVRVVRA